ncbi:MAG: crotonobetainyl-CoA--carnitine CoA-transferase [Desulfamplus sp.]|nr:crotonobetainyl-CoA--carnitine CoA-transferase [Desulfamplus sp.]
MNQIDTQELYSSNLEKEIRGDFVCHFRECPIPEADILNNLGLFLNSKNLSRILFMDHIYQQIVETMGVIMEFGTRWGQNISLFSALRGIYEPFNRHRKIIGFDTFTGFPDLTEQDNTACNVIRKGGLATPENYEKYLKKVMHFQECDNPLSHICKYEIRKGDAVVEIEQYLDENPETIISLAFFDFDIYLPTKKCLEMIKDRLVKGSIVAFDELNDHDSPGETIALMEVFGLRNLRLKRHRYTSRISYFVME